MSLILTIFAALVFLSTTLFAECELVICSIFQDEAPYFKEWIEFHKLQGVEHFYLYNNNSEDNYREALNPYILTKEVTLIEWPYTYEYGDHKNWIKIQTSAFTHCIKRYGKKVRWIAFIDIDEFLFCPNGEKLPNFLKDYLEFGGVCVNWIKFGTSDIEEIPEGVCLIELLTRCSCQNHPDNTLVKSIVQPKHIKKGAQAHFFEYKPPQYAVNANKEKCEKFRTLQHCSDRIRINHYWTRTVKYFLNNKIESRQKRRPQFTTDIILKMNEEYNQCLDTLILRYVDDLRRAMGYEK